jgi:hypothetical protein
MDHPRPYLRANPDSPIVAYQVGPDHLWVGFAQDGGRFAYRYTAALVGARHLAAMQALAISGAGLATYISRHLPKRARCFDRKQAF